MQKASLWSPEALLHAALRNPRRSARGLSIKAELGYSELEFFLYQSFP